MKKLLFFLFFAFPIIIIQAQTVDEIKADHLNYLWGEGSGITLKKADQEALAMLISLISTHVESSFTLLKSEMIKSGEEDHFTETFNSVIKTYSGATLKNTERIVIGNEPDAKVFRYIKRDEISKVFKERKDKILGFVKNAEQALEKKQIADGLRYYYWALTLLKSHPEGSSVEYYDQNGEKQLLATWLPMQMNSIFANLNFKLEESSKQDNYSVFTLHITYKNSDVNNFDYSYWDGTDWSNLISARDGKGIIELYGVAANVEKLKLKAEYIFEGEARIDRELEDVLKRIDPIPFRNSYFTIDLKETEAVKKDIDASNVDSKITYVEDTEPYRVAINLVLQSINNKTYESVKKFVSKDGYDAFTKLINYGNAKILGQPDLSFVKFEQSVICRAVPMSFNFKGNHKQFVENVVFHFNNDKLIENLSFGLSKIALDDIIKKEVWKEHDRLVLVNFLENYKTAYALKRINYIEQIFADDALIITGKVVKVKPNEINQYRSNTIVKYNQQSKQQYVKNLRYSFGSKEYINLKFEQSKIRKAGKGGDIYGVQIKQNYYSSNYGDVGYLFLMVDLNNPAEPIIHVRTWQPEVGLNDSVYGLSDFN